MPRRQTETKLTREARADAIAGFLWAVATGIVIAFAIVYCIAASPAYPGV